LSKEKEEELLPPRNFISDYRTSPKSDAAEESIDENLSKFRFCRQKIKKKSSETKFIHTIEYKDLIRIDEESKRFQDFKTESFTNEILL